MRRPGRPVDSAAPAATTRAVPARAVPILAAVSGAVVSGAALIGVVSWLLPAGQLEPIDVASLQRAGAMAGAEQRGVSPLAPVAVADTLILEFVGGDGEWRRFEVSVVEPLTDVTAALSSVDGGGALPPVGELLARTRLRIGYLDGPQLGSLAPLTVAVEANGEERLVTDEGCAGLEEPLDTEAEIERGTYVEGEICWPIPAIWVPDLLLVIEADRGERRWLALH